MQDPLANPVWFFKGKNRDQESEKLLNLDGYEQRLKEHTRKEQMEMAQLYQEIEGEILVDKARKERLRQEVKRNAEAAQRRKEAAMEELSKKGPVKVTIDKKIMGQEQKPWTGTGHMKARPGYQSSWKKQIVGKRDQILDYQGLSDEIRPANTIYKSRQKTDYMKSKEDRDEEDDD